MSKFITTKCGIDKFNKLRDQKGFFKKIRFYWFVIIASVREPGVVVVVTHGGCIYALEALLGEKYRRISNLGGRWLEIKDGTFTLGERTRLLEPDEETYPDQI